MKRSQRRQMQEAIKEIPFAVFCLDTEKNDEASKLAETMKAPFFTSPESMEKTALYVVYDQEGTCLTDGEMTLRGDYIPRIRRLKHHNLTHEALIKAAHSKDKKEHLTAIDGTAGLGEDSLLLAAYGFSVTLCEHNPVIAALLKDTLARARIIPELEPVVSRMTVYEGSSLTCFASLTTPPDIILLDPMFPERKKKSKVKEKLQLIQKLEPPCSEETALFDAAMAAQPSKIIVKRPLKSPYLDERVPSYSLKGKAIRYDCYSPYK